MKPWPPLILAAALAACSSGPAPPDWQLQSKSAIEASIAMDLNGDTAAARREFDRGRALLARTGQPGLLARAELMRCAARVASLDFAACDGFERWRSEAPAAEQAYADHLAGRTLEPARIALLPAAQRGAASAIAAKAPLSVQGIEDPQSRLIAAALLLRARLADPATLTLAAETASAQGWRRPLVAWLEALAYRAEQAGSADEAQRLRRRIELVLSAR